MDKLFVAEEDLLLDAYRLGVQVFAAVETLAVKVLDAAHSASEDLTTGTVTVTPMPGIVLSRTALALEEDPTAGGGTNANVGTYTFTLTADPSGTGRCGHFFNVTSNNADVAVNPGQFAIDGTNWNTPQTVTVTAAGDADGVDDAATLTHSVNGNCVGGIYHTSNTFPGVRVTVNDDETPTAAIASPSVLTAATLPTASVTVSLDKTTYASGVTAASFELVTGVANLSIASATASAGGTSATLTLSHSGTLGADDTLAVRVLAAAHAGDTDLTTGQIDVLVADTAPSFGASVSRQYARRGVAIAPFQIPAATGGNGAISYEASGLLAGLKFDVTGTDPGGCTAADFPTGTAATWATAPRTVCGTPTADGFNTFNVRFIAFDADSNRASSDEATLVVAMDIYSASIASTSPSPLTEGGLNGATVSVTLSNARFASGVTAASFELVTAIPGVSVSQVSSVSSGDTSATLTLAFTGDFSGARTLGVKVLDAAHTGDGDLTTATVPVTARPGVTVSRDRLALNEPPSPGASGSCTVVLDAAPPATCSLTVSVTSANADVSVSPATLTFTDTTWSTPQRVRVTAGADADAILDTDTVSHALSASTCTGYPTTVADAQVGAAIATTPAVLTESTLHGATVAVTLNGTTFAAGAPAAGTGAFELVTTIPNLSIAQISGVSAGGTTATLTLAFTGDFRALPTLAVRVPAATHTGSGNLTSNAVTVTADAGVTVSEASLSLDEDPGSTNANRGDVHGGAGQPAARVHRRNGMPEQQRHRDRGERCCRRRRVAGQPDVPAHRRDRAVERPADGDGDGGPGRRRRGHRGDHQPRLRHPVVYRRLGLHHRPCHPQRLRRSGRRRDAGRHHRRGPLDPPAWTSPARSPSPRAAPRRRRRTGRCASPRSRRRP